MINSLAFFSGGSAIKSLSQYMARAGLASSHLVSVFDSGGSSAKLRKAFAMPAVGDLRNRLLALAESHVPPELIAFCNLRLPISESQPELAARLNNLAQLSSNHWQELPKYASRAMWLALRHFIKAMPKNFDLAGACLGNLMLAGVYLRSGRNLAQAIAFFSNLLHAQGAVLPVTAAYAHLGAKLVDGSTIVGQHLFHNLTSPVSELFLTVHESSEALAQDASAFDCNPPLFSGCEWHLRKASLICYPMGSFFSSILANLFVKNVGKIISASPGKKVFIPNSGFDPELFGLNIAAQAKLILQFLKKDAPGADTRSLLNHVLIDSHNGKYPGGVGPDVRQQLDELGIGVVDRPLIADNPSAHIPELVIKALQELSGC